MTLSEKEWEEYFELSEVIGGTPRKCRKCGRINTHRLRDGILICNGEPADESTWEDLE